MRKLKLFSTENLDETNLEETPVVEETVVEETPTEETEEKTLDIVDIDSDEVVDSEEPEIEMETEEGEVTTEPTEDGVEESVEADVENLEADVAEMDQLAEASDEFEEDVDQLEVGVDALEDKVEEGEVVDSVTTEMIRVTMKRMERKYGISTPKQSFAKENFVNGSNTNRKRSVVALEEAKGFLKKAKNFLIELWAKLKDIAKDFFHRYLTAVGRAEERLKKISEGLSLNSESYSNVTFTIPEKLANGFMLGGVSETKASDAIVAVINSHITATADYVSFMNTFSNLIESGLNEKDGSKVRGFTNDNYQSQAGLLFGSSKNPLFRGKYFHFLSKTSPIDEGNQFSAEWHEADYDKVSEPLEITIKDKSEADDFIKGSLDLLKHSKTDAKEITNKISELDSLIEKTFGEEGGLDELDKTAFNLIQNHLKIYAMKMVPEANRLFSLSFTMINGLADVLELSLKAVAKTEDSKKEG